MLGCRWKAGVFCIRSPSQDLSKAVSSDGKSISLSTISVTLVMFACRSQQNALHAGMAKRTDGRTDGRENTDLCLTQICDVGWLADLLPHLAVSCLTDPEGGGSVRRKGPRLHITCIYLLMPRVKFELTISQSKNQMAAHVLEPRSLWLADIQCTCCFYGTRWPVTSVCTRNCAWNYRCSSEGSLACLLVDRSVDRTSESL